MKEETQDKFVLQSRTVIASIVGMLVILLPLFGIGFSQEEAALLTENLDKVVLGGAFVATFVFRVWAKAKLFFRKEDVVVNDGSDADEHF